MIVNPKGTPGTIKIDAVGRAFGRVRRRFFPTANVTISEWTADRVAMRASSSDQVVSRVAAAVSCDEPPFAQHCVASRPQWLSTRVFLRPSPATCRLAFRR